MSAMSTTDGMISRSFEVGEGEEEILCFRDYAVQKYLALLSAVALPKTTKARKRKKESSGVK